MTEHFDSVQILRAMAAWTVVYHHYIQFFGTNFTQFAGTGLLIYGNFGVDVFFVISGFIMYESVRNRPQTAVDFMKRRIIRIVPNYWFYTALLIACCLVAPNAFSFFRPFNLESVGKSLLFIPHQNPSGKGVLPLLTVGWTLNYEMLFYAVFASCLLLPRRYTSLAAVAILLMLPALAQFFPSLMSALGPGAVLMSGHYLPEFALGICVGMAHAACSPNGKWWRLSGVAIGLLALVYMFNDGRRELAAAGVLWGALCVNVRSNSPVIRFAMHLGNTSYSTYLCHTLILAAVLGAIGKPTGLMAELSVIAAISLLTVALSEFSYRLIERGGLSLLVRGNRSQAS